MKNANASYSFDEGEAFDPHSLSPELAYQGSTFSLEDDQLKAIKGILAWLYENPRSRAPFKRLSGNAGSGKTLCISYLLQASAEIFPKYMRTRPVAVCTFTWKAALVLRSRNVHACSIHSIFYKPCGERGGSIQFERVPPEEVRETYSMIVVDESSMVDSVTRSDIEAIGLPVLYVGDSAQLPAISNDPIDSTFMEKSEFHLTKIRRQALDSPIIRLSMDIRNGKRIKFGKYGDGVFKIYQEEVTEKMLIRTDQILCGMNKTRTWLNKKVRKLHGHNRLMMPYENERIIGLNNIPERGLFNGQAWKVTRDYSDTLLESSNRTVIELQGDDGKKQVQQCWFPDDLKLNSFRSTAHAARFMKQNKIYSVDFGYAITVHKSQGSSFRRPIIFEEWFGEKEFQQKWLYTAVTRAVEKVFIVSN